MNNNKIMFPGIVLVNKMENESCMNVMKNIKKKFGIKKIGNAGTLDEAASGLLILFINKATKLQNFYQNDHKTYEFILNLNIETDTLDNVGKILKQTKDKHDIEKIKEVINTFNNKKYLQIPPIFSAVKINGKKLHQYARDNIDVDIPPRNVHIKKIKLIKIISEDKFLIEANVSKGTYIRSLARDLSHAIGTIGIATNIKRTYISNNKLENTPTWNNIEKDNFIRIEDFFKFPKIEISKIEKKYVDNNNIISINCDNEYCFLSFDKQIIALYKKHNENYYKGLFNI